MHSKYKNFTKIQIRNEQINIYKNLTGNLKLPSSEQYWCLCNEQDNSEESEINQLTQLCFIEKKQFFGIDSDSNLIKKNENYHPTANWFCGKWKNVIMKHENFKPGLIYLDTTGMLSTYDTKLDLLYTLNECKHLENKVVIFANFIKKNPFSGKKDEDPISSIIQLAENKNKTFEKFTLQGHFEYENSKTVMQTLIFTNFPVFTI